MAEKMLKTPAAPSEPDSIFHNLRRITSIWNIIVFIVNPAFAWFVYVYLCLHLAENSIIPPRVRFFSGFVYFLFSCGVMCATSEDVQIRLQKAGHTQRKSRRRVLNLLLNYIVCGASFYWVQSWDTDGEQSRFWTYVHIVVTGLNLWYGLFLAVLGPTVWFTVPVEGEE